MWSKTHSTFTPGLQPSQVWKIWSDINNRPQWDLDIEWAELQGSFEKGAVFRFKPKGGPKLKMSITDCKVNEGFTDCYKVPFARLLGVHQMEARDGGLQISTTIVVDGLLGWLMRKIIAEKVAAEVPEQTAMLIKLASELK